MLKDKYLLTRFSGMANISSHLLRCSQPVPSAHGCFSGLDSPDGLPFSPIGRAAAGSLLCDWCLSVYPQPTF